MGVPFAPQPESRSLWLATTDRKDQNVGSSIYEDPSFRVMVTYEEQTANLGRLANEYGRLYSPAYPFPVAPGEPSVRIQTKCRLCTTNMATGMGSPKYASDTSSDDEKRQNNEMISSDIRTKLPLLTTLPPSYQQYEPLSMFEADTNLTLWKAKTKRHLLGVPPEYQSIRILDRLSDRVQKLVLQQHVDEECPPRKIWETIDSLFPDLEDPVSA
ncbi:unnamed protein product [Echinostoma caproni]|uniref:Uncharacterized protein n=1 Tax=Echinostoma caproni TaxID=27848 RepID=A0A183BCF2_9TREM|nr:unnamed protein product [Echinostoma caproni]